MKIENIILDFVKSKNKKKEIAGLRGLVKISENEWSFRFTYRDGDFLAVSKLFKIKLKGAKKIPIFVSEKEKKSKLIITKSIHYVNK